MNYLTYCSIFQEFSALSVELQKTVGNIILTFIILLKSGSKFDPIPGEQRSAVYSAMKCALHIPAKRQRHNSKSKIPKAK